MIIERQLVAMVKAQDLNIGVGKMKMIKWEKMVVGVVIFTIVREVIYVLKLL